MIDSTCRVPVAEISLGAFPRGAALILCDAESVGEVDVSMNALAEQGYESLAAGLSPTSMAQDDRIVDVLLEQLGARGWEHEQLGVIGYGRGAHSALRAAARYVLGAAVSVMDLTAPDTHGPVAQAVAALRTPWLGLTSVAADDGWHGVSQRLNQVRATQARVYTEVIGYPGVSARFYQNTTADTLAHAAAFDSWQRTVEWLNSRVVPRLTPASLAWRAGLPAHCGAP